MTDNLPAETSNLPALVQLHPIESGESAIRYVERLMQLLPAPDENTVEKIAAQIIAADNMVDENEMWESTGSAKLIGRRFRFDSLTLLPSTYDESPFGWYLGIQAVDTATGEEVFITSGSVNLVTSLVKAHFLGNLPAIGEIMGPRRPPKSGHTPLHMRWQARVAVSNDE